MKISDYFTEKKGTGVLATADKEGNVNSAIYAKPHILEGDRVAFIMRQRMTHKNLQENVSANYLFKEDGSGYQGVRLYLEKTAEEKNSRLIERLGRRKNKDSENGEVKPRYLVYFQVKKIVSLIGDQPADVSIGQ